MTIEDLEGTYFIQGSNQVESDEVTYQGILTLFLNEEGSITANWSIEGQLQHGVGFYNDHLLVINFCYIGDDFLDYKGVVLYRCFSGGFLDGFWFEDEGDSQYLGTEKAQKIDSQHPVS